MASVIPRSYRKEIADALDAETLYVALFTNSMSTYDPLNVNQDTYAEVAALYTEVSAVGTGYTTGGVELTTNASNGATNYAILTGGVTTIPAASFTCRYAVVYRTSDGKIRAVIDLGGDKTVTSGTMTITWDATNGLLKIS